MEAQGPTERGQLLQLPTAQLRPNPLSQVTLAIRPPAMALEQAAVEDQVQAIERRNLDGLPETSGRKGGAKDAEGPKQSTRLRKKSLVSGATFSWTCAADPTADARGGSPMHGSGAQDYSLQVP